MFGKGKKINAAEAESWLLVPSIGQAEEIPINSIFYGPYL